MSLDWCDLCELPTSQCPHGAPPPAPPAPTSRKAPASRTRRTTAGSSASSAAAPRSSATVTRRAPRTPPGRTPQTDFRPHLLAVLAEQPVAIERDAVLAELAERMSLTDQDRALTADGEVRWRRTALKERKAMADEGLFGSAGHGMWVLSPAGRDAAAPDGE